MSFVITGDAISTFPCRIRNFELLSGSLIVITIEPLVIIISQFFIMQKDAPHLDGQYSAFGNVVRGIEIVDSIVQVEKDSNEHKVYLLSMINLLFTTAY